MSHPDPLFDPENVKKEDEILDQANLNSYYDESDPMCVCGDRSSLHIDGCEQCFNGDCGCPVFEEYEPEEE